ncbi:MAG: helix-turn-helix domain-containing protein [Oscillospiraceae bacterium]|nr:helix-turn-helix domain-containing protein [Oscillospiraceae bacterium]
MNKETVSKLVGERIAECRKKKGLTGMTQSDLAAKLGKSLRTIQKYESGDIDITLSALVEISEVLGVSVNYLVGYQPSHIKLESLSDVQAFIIELDKKEELHFDLDVNKDDNQCSCSLTFSSPDIHSILNSELCRFLETFKTNREALQSYWIDYETFEAWANSAVEKNQLSFIHDREIKPLDSSELAKKREELNKKD